MDCEASMDDHLERVLLDASIEPRYLQFADLKACTDNFADDKQIGKGGFATVYKGQIRNGTIAVKKLSQTIEVDEKRFLQELTSLMKVKHKNIVRFLGYCADTQGKMCKYDGKNVMAEERQRLLCFEFLPKGSLDKYITDASHGLEWRIRYRIIKGICEGLHYLHQNRIVHLDLKPANILLTDNMVPKITDFGLSRIFDENQSRAITSKVVGSMGYMAPESYNGEITLESDIYSLGVIIMEILTGQKGYSEIENVLKSWSNRLETLNRDTHLKQVRVCAEIGVECTNMNPAKRPKTEHILEALHEMEQTYGFIETGLCTSSATRVTSDSVQLLGVDVGNLQFISEVRSTGSSMTSNLLDIHPQELRFPFKPNEVIRCPVSLTNRTDHYLAVWITPTNPEQDIYCYGPFKYSLIDPHSTWVVVMKMEKRQQPPQREEKFEVLVLAMGSEIEIRDLKSSLGDSDKEQGIMSIDFRKQVEELGGEVQVTMLTAVICDPGSHKAAGTNKIISRGKLGRVFSMDVHPTQTWIITGHERGYFSIVNYQAQVREMVLLVTRESPDPVYSVKFIAQEKWFATGDGHGWVNVYAHTSSVTANVIKKIRAYGGKPVTSLAVHPTYPYLLTSSKYDNSIELWDWGQGWSCVRTFDGHIAGVGNLTFNRGEKSFASVGYDNREAKVWSINSSEPITTLVVPAKVENLCSAGAQDFLLVASCDSYAYIWDLQRGERIHKLGGHGLTICDVASHPTLPILATSSRDGTVCLWDAGTYRLEKIVNDHLPPLGDMVALALTGTEGLTSRVVVGCKDGIAIMDTNLPMGSSSCVSKFAGEVQSTVVSAPPLDSTSSDSTSSNSEVIDIIKSLELCFPFKPSKHHHNYPATLTNRTNHYVGVWITLTPVGANSWPVNESLMENPCSFFVMEPNSTWVATVTTEQQQLPSSRDTCKFEMRLIVMGSELDLPNLESPPTNGSELSMGGGELLKLVEVSGGKLPQAMLMAAIYNPGNCKTATTHQITSATEFGRVVSMDVHPTEPWILAGHKGGGFVSIWNYQTQQRANASKVTASAVFSVKFIVRDQWLAVAAGDAYGSVHIINVNAACSKMNKDTRIKLWNWDQGWVCTRIFEGRTWGVRHLAFNATDINTFASVDKYGSRQVWNINSSTDDPTQWFVEPENVDLFFTDRHRHFMISCDSDDIGSNADIWDLETKERLQTFPIFTRSNLHKNDVRVNGGEIKEKAKNKSGAKQKHGGGGDNANNGSGEGGPGPGGSNHQQPGTMTMGGGGTSMPMGHPNTSSMPAPGKFYSVFSDENPNGCSMM